MILQLGNYIKAEVYVTLHISVECGQLSRQYGGMKQDYLVVEDKEIQIIQLREY